MNIGTSNSNHTTGTFLRGIGIGLAAGAAISLVMMPKSEKNQFTPSKAVQNIGTMLEHLGRNMS